MKIGRINNSDFDNQPEKDNNISKSKKDLHKDIDYYKANHPMEVIGRSMLSFKGVNSADSLVKEAVKSGVITEEEVSNLSKEDLNAKICVYSQNKDINPEFLQLYIKCVNSKTAKFMSTLLGDKDFFELLNNKYFAKDISDILLTDFDSSNEDIQADTDIKLEMYKLLKNQEGIDEEFALFLSVLVNTKNTELIQTLNDDNVLDLNRIYDIQDITLSDSPTLSSQQKTELYSRRLELYNKEKNNKALDMDILMRVLKEMNNDNYDEIVKDIDAIVDFDKWADENNYLEDKQSRNTVKGCVNEQTLDFVKTLVQDNIIPVEDFRYIVRTKKTPEEQSFLKSKMDFYYEYRKSPECNRADMESIMQYVFPANKDYICMLIKDKDFPNNRIPQASIFPYSQKNPEQIVAVQNEIYTYLKDNPDISKETLADILGSVSDDNSNFVLYLVKDNYLPPKDIRFVVQQYNNNEKNVIDAKQEIYDILKNDRGADPNSIYSILSRVNIYNFEFITSLLNTKKVPYAKINDVIYTPGKYKEESEKIITARKEIFEFINEKRPDEDGQNIVGILGEITEQNKDIAKTLIENNMMSGENVISMLKSGFDSESLENLDLISEIINLVKSSPDIGNETANAIINTIEPENSNFIKLLLSDDSFPKDRISDIARLHSNDKKQEIQAKTDFYNYVKSLDKQPEQIYFAIVLRSIKKENLEFAKKYFNPESQEKYVFSEILDAINPVNENFAEILINDTTFPNDRIKSSVRLVGENLEEQKINNSKKIEFYEYAKENSLISTATLSNFLPSITEKNINFAKILAVDEYFKDYAYISDILNNSYNKNGISDTEKRQKIYDKLRNDASVPKDVLLDIMSTVNAINYPLAELLINDNDFPKEQIKKVIPDKYYYSDTEEKVNARIEFYKYASSLPNIEKTQIADVMQNIDEHNIEYVKELMTDGIFDFKEIKEILSSDIPQNIKTVLHSEEAYNDKFKTAHQFYTKMKNKGIEHYVLKEALKNINSFNTELLEAIVQDKDLNYSVIYDIATCKESDKNILSDTFKARLSLYKNKRSNSNVSMRDLSMIMGKTNLTNIKLSERYVGENNVNNYDFASILDIITPENIDFATKLLAQKDTIKIDERKIKQILFKEITEEEFQKFLSIVDKEKVSKYNEIDYVFAINFVEAYQVKDINELSISSKKQLLRKLVKGNVDLFTVEDELRKDFPLLPKDTQEYCTLLPQIVRAMGIETKELSEAQIKDFNKNLSALADTLKSIEDEDFNSITIEKEQCSNEKFIENTLSAIKDLSRIEKQQVFDYYGFELEANNANSTGYSIKGYPANLNNGEKLAKITNPKVRQVIEDLRDNVIEFSENNYIKCSNKEMEILLNKVISVLPELRPQIGKIQAGMNGTKGSHEFDIFKHSLKVMQKIVQYDNYSKLNDSDKKIILLASLLHDITKKEGRTDITHPNESAFDAFFITDKFNLTKEEKIKLHTLIAHHEWLSYVNSFKDENESKKRMQSIAYDLRHDNIFDMSLIFTHADLKAVKSNNSFHDNVNGKGRREINGEKRSFGEAAEIYAGKYNDNLENKTIRGYINELKKSQPLLPVTKFPAASRINEAITEVHPDGSTNIKGVYKKGELVVLKYNEVENWEEIGFPKGSTSRGINCVNELTNENINTGNIKFFIHALDYPNQLVKFDAFSLVDSDALLSVSYAERPESKYRFFRAQGVILNTDTKYIHGGGQTDSGSGYGKSIEKFKERYLFGAERYEDRIYISKLIKEATGMSDTEYIDFVKKNENKPFSEIEPENVRTMIIKAFSNINSNKRKGNRAYNEMYISNPQTPMGVFAYGFDVNGKIGNPVDFLNSQSRTHFLQEYAVEHNVPFVIFGD